MRNGAEKGKCLAAFRRADGLDDGICFAGMREQQCAEDKRTPGSGGEGFGVSGFAQVGLPEMPGCIGEKKEQGQVGMQPPDCGAQGHGAQIEADEAQERNGFERFEMGKVIEGAVRDADGEQPDAHSRPCGVFHASAVEDQQCNGCEQWQWPDFLVFEALKDVAQGKGEEQQKRQASENLKVLAEAGVFAEKVQHVRQGGASE